MPRQERLDAPGTLNPIIIRGIEKRKYMKEGLNQGNRPELVRCGLIRSLGGWSAMLSLRKENERPLTNERVLGSGEFVEKLIKEADEKTQ